MREINIAMGIRWSHGSLIAMSPKGDGHYEMVYWDGQEWRTDDTAEAVYDFLIATHASEQRLRQNGINITETKENL